jgi:hypothetical protein
MRKIYSLGTLVLSLFLGFSMSAQVTLVGWEVTGQTGYGVSPFTPTTLATNVTSSGLVRGSGIATTGSAASNAWGGVGFNVDDTTAISTGRFVSFTINPSVGHKVSVDSIPPYNIRRSPSGPTFGQWQYAINGGSFVNIGGPITWGSTTTASGNLQSPISLSGISALQDVEFGNTITFRLVIWGASAAGGTWYINNITGEDLRVLGTVEAVSSGGECSIDVEDVEIVGCTPGFGENLPRYDLDVTISYENPASNIVNIFLNGSQIGSVNIGAQPNPFVFNVTDQNLSAFSNFITVEFEEIESQSSCTDFFFLSAPEGCELEEGACEELYFSEYIEGSSTNKAIEIFNPTGTGIDLGAEGYVLQFYFNGSTTAGFSQALTGIIPAGGTYVIGPENANSAEILNNANLLVGTSWFNGDDVVVLRAGGASGTIVDRIGQIGLQVNFGTDVTLRRKFNVTQGDTDAFSAWTNAQWDVFPNNTFDGLRSHNSVCLTGETCLLDGIFFTGSESFECFVNRGPLPASCFFCDDNNTSTTADDTFVFSADIAYFGVPQTGSLLLLLNNTVLETIPVSQLMESEFGGFYPVFIELPADGQTYTFEAIFTDVQNCNVSLSFEAPEACSVSEPCVALFFSEYLEGTGNNKCVEIYNPTDQTIDLAAGGYRFNQFFNGNTNPLNAGQFLSIPLTGLIAPYGTHVLCNTSTTPSIRDFAHQLAGGSWYNGNDVLVLENNEGVLDIIGQLGNSSNFGLDVTLRRKSFVNEGRTNGSLPFVVADEWETFPVNTQQFRFHKSECAPIINGLVPVQMDPNCFGALSGTENPFAINIDSRCWGGAIGRTATMYVADHCGDFDISAKVEVSALGFAGIMFRETMAAETRYVYLFVRGNGQATLAVKNTINQGMQPQLQIRPQQNRQYIRLTRVGNVFRGYMSHNGSNWQEVFRAVVSLESCGFAGFATHSGCNGINCLVNSSYTDIVSNVPGVIPTIHTNQDQFAAATWDRATDEVQISPNPVTTQLTIDVPYMMVGSTTYQILDMNGRIIHQDRSDRTNKIQVNLGPINMPDGVYILHMIHDGQVINKRFIKSSN